MDSDWRAHALCSHFPGLPWIAEPEDQAVAAVRGMTVVCLACPVTERCARYVVEAEIVSGFWAGSDRTPTRAAHNAGGAA